MNEERGKERGKGDEGEDCAAAYRAAHDGTKGVLFSVNLICGCVVV